MQLEQMIDLKLGMVIIAESDLRHDLSFRAAMPFGRAESQ